MYDIAVIGLGMIGSAALRYLSRPTSGLRAVGVGPAEPHDWASHQGAFASHYDQARITRITDPDRVWATLAQRAIASYPAIEQASGIRFHYPSGHLRVAPSLHHASDLLADAEAIGLALGAPIERLDAAQLAARYPYLRIPAEAAGLYERGGAGFINPRALVAAQLTIAAAQGAALVRDEVASSARTPYGFALTTRGGQTITAARVLVCAHGYSNALLPGLAGRTLSLVSMAHTTVYATIGPDQAARLAGMPSLIWAIENHPVLESVYTTPPTTYPDGRVGLKIGGPLHTHPTLDTPAAMRAWFQSPGNPAEIAALEQVLAELVPGLVADSWVAKPCMNTYTAHGYPYVGQLAAGVFVCTGGCGGAAKSSDEIGHMGALLAQHGAWHYDLPAETFRPVEGYYTLSG